MFSHRGLFLAVTISLASIALAGVLVQPAYEHQYDSNPRYLQHQSVSQHWIRSPTEQYRAEQLPDQESTRYLPGVETKKNKDPKEAERKRMEEYGRKMDFIRHMDGGRSLQPVMVHNRRKRSDPASTESEIIDNDVAAKSSLTDANHPTIIDSLLPENEPTTRYYYTTNKSVQKCQVEDYITSYLPRLLIPLLPSSIANATRDLTEMTARMKNITVYQAYVNMWTHLLDKRVEKGQVEVYITHLPRLLIPLLPSSIANAMRLMRDLTEMIARVRNITLFEIIVNNLTILLGFLPYQKPMIMICTSV